MKNLNAWSMTKTWDITAFQKGILSRTKTAQHQCMNIAHEQLPCNNSNMRASIRFGEKDGKKKGGGANIVLLAYERHPKKNVFFFAYSAACIWAVPVAHCLLWSVNTRPSRARGIMNCRGSLRTCGAGGSHAECMAKMCEVLRRRLIGGYNGVPRRIPDK